MEYEKRKRFIVNILYGVFILLMIYVVLRYGVGLISPFLLGFLIAYMLRRPTRYLSRKLSISYQLVAVVLVLLFYSTIGVLLTLLSIKLVTGIGSFFATIPYLYTQYMEPSLALVFGYLQELVSRMDPALLSALESYYAEFLESLGKLISSVSVGVVSIVSGVASSLPGILLKMLLMVISSFFIAMDYDLLVSFVLRQFTEKGKSVIFQVKNYVIGTLFVCIRSYGLIMLITFVELSVGLTIIGIHNSVLIALSIAVFDILPVLGTGGIMIPWTLITLLQGDYPTAIGLLLVYLVVTVIRNILEPKIVGSQIGLHSVVTLASMFVGVQLFGAVGLFGFPITLSLLRHLNDTGTIRLFK